MDLHRVLGHPGEYYYPEIDFKFAGVFLCHNENYSQRPAQGSKLIAFS